MIAREQFAQECDALSKEGLLRTLRVLPAAGGKIVVDGRAVLNFSSNDYLKLAGDDRVKSASARAVAECGCGATASRLMSGSLALHEELERRLARLVGCERALVFGSGFLTNLGVVTSLAGRGDAIFADRLCHASLIDGARLSGARFHRFGHNDVAHLEELLRRHAPKGRSVILSDSVFSMDGDVAPVEALSRAAERSGAVLVIDEAHAIGVFGRGGGVCRQMGCGVRTDVVVGTLSKALGGYGGFAAGSAEVVKLLVNKARSFIYSTGLPPACLGSALGALDAIEETPAMGEKLLNRAADFRKLLSREGLDVSRSGSPIVPVMVGDNEKAVELSRRLFERGVIAVAIRPPTVPAGTARLRLSVTLAHEEEDLEMAARVLAAACREMGIL